MLKIRQITTKLTRSKLSRQRKNNILKQPLIIARPKTVKPEDETVLKSVMSRKFCFPTTEHFKIVSTADRVMKVSGPAENRWRKHE